MWLAGARGAAHAAASAAGAHLPDQLKRSAADGAAPLVVLDEMAQTCLVEEVAASSLALRSRESGKASAASSAGANLAA